MTVTQEQIQKVLNLIESNSEKELVEFLNQIPRNQIKELLNLNHIIIAAQKIQKLS